MTDQASTTPTPESELVARLRSRPDRVKHGALGYYSPNDAALDTEAAATIERAHEQGRREGIEMAAKVADEESALRNRAGDNWDKTPARDARDDEDYGRFARMNRLEAECAVRIATAIRALSSAPPGEPKQ